MTAGLEWGRLPRRPQSGVGLGAVLLLASCTVGEPREPADLILAGGHVVTMDVERPTAEAIAIRGDRIVAVGSDAEIALLRGADTRFVDLGGATAVPGLIDAHLHFPRIGQRSRQLFLDRATSPDEIIETVREQAAAAEPGGWITGHGWHTVNWESDEYPDHRGLTQVAPDNPVFLVGMANHAAWVNARALEFAGITPDTPDPPGGQIRRDAETGEPTGILTERAMALVSAAIPAPTRNARKADIRRSGEIALRMGLTSVQDLGVDEEALAIYRELLEDGALGVRVYAARSVSGPGESLERAIAQPPEIGLGGHRLTVRAIKVFADGALGARGAALIEPYSDSPEERGLVQNSQDDLEVILNRAGRTGYQVAIHAIGDLGNRVALNAIERARPAIPDSDPRMRIEHAQILSPDDLQRFAELGVIASMQPIHSTMDMGFTETRVGPERVRGAYAFRSLLASGARIAAGSDTPAFPVEYNDPRWGLHAAVTRQDHHGRPAGGWFPEEAVTVEQALRMFTVDAAYAAFEEDLKGSLRPGKLADVTVFSRDILSIPPDQLLETGVLMTIVGGTIEFASPAFRTADPGSPPATGGFGSTDG